MRFPGAAKIGMSVYRARPAIVAAAGGHGVPHRADVVVPALQERGVLSARVAVAQVPLADQSAAVAAGPQYFGESNLIER